jgi:hypothetical protein
MVRQVCSIVRASALRSKVFILAKACSIGLRFWRVGGQEQELGFGHADGGANGAALMTSEVVHDDNVAWREDREENLLDISAEACAIDRSVDDAGRGQLVATQRRQKREGPPSAEGRFGDEARAGASAMDARHVGFRPEPGPAKAGVSSMNTSRLGSIVA